MSVFLRSNASRRQVSRLGHELRISPLVARTFYESRATAYREFRRLYACWASVRRSATPASYRLILTSGVTIAQRDRLVGRLAGLPIVDGVSCDPSLQCLAVVGTPSPP